MPTNAPPACSFTRILTAICIAPLDPQPGPVQFVPSGFSPGRDQAQLPLSRPNLDTQQGKWTAPRSQIQLP